MWQQLCSNSFVKTKILVVDDEPDVLDLVTYNLGQAGFQTETAVDGADALRKARTITPDLILLDLMLPEMDGLEVCKLLRRDSKTSDIPIIMLTARASELDRIVGLELGATDYVPKPFSPRELVLRVKRRLEQNNGPQPKTQHVFGPLQVDTSRHLVTVKSKRVELTATEFKLLTLLIQRAGHVQSRDQLLRDVWEYESHIDTRTVDTHMRRLREKLGPAARFLDTVRGVGYRFQSALN
ncbi:MAG TPA: response regulator transcription factor [Verrucomicrobiae bacterium]|jgi:two-component system phosphate regulon response regulator PhoB